MFNNIEFNTLIWTVTKMHQSLPTTPSPTSTSADTGIIIAGKGDNQKEFIIPKPVLERSLIINAWIEEPSSISQSLRGARSLNFPECEPEVVDAGISHLEKAEEKSVVIVTNNDDGLFYAKVYRLALCLA